MDVKWVCQAYKMELEDLGKCGNECPKWRAVGEGEPEGEEKDFDALLGTFNRGYFNQRLAKEFSYAKATPGELSVVMSDIDNFKRVNDTHGHLAGDDVLKFVARTAKQVVGAKGVVCRYGGEEIVFILPNYRLSEAVPLAERFREAVASYPFKVKDKQGLEQSLSVTLSLGAASLHQDMSQESDLVRVADACLYEAKKQGKNRVIYA
jgi:diguanylate cyclase (GGDEF)-like protein